MFGCEIVCRAERTNAQNSVATLTLDGSTSSIPKSQGKLCESQSHGY